MIYIRYALSLLLIALLLPMLCAAQEAETQTPPLERLVSVNFDKTPLRDAAEEMLRDTGLKLRIESGAGGSVSLQLQDFPLGQAIAVVLRATGSTGGLDGDTLVIAPMPKDLLPRGSQPAFPLTDHPKPTGTTIRAGLLSSVGRHQSVTIACSGKYRIVGTDGPEVTTESWGGEQITLTAKDGAIEVRRLGCPDVTRRSPVRVETERPTTALEVISPIVKHPRYGGALEFTAQGSALRVVNELPLDDYVRGVVPTEVPASFHPEAQKALVVAARTYALRNSERHKADGFNMCDSVHCQGFAGASRDADWVNKIVDATRGEIMTHKGEPIYALYSADCGGMTQSSEDSGMIKAPYLLSVSDNESGESCVVRQKQAADSSQPPAGVPEPSDVSDPSDESDVPDLSEACPAPAMTEFEKPATGDYCGASRNHTWTRTYSAEDLEKVFSRSSSTSVGKLLSMEFAEYDCSGRVKTIVIRGEDGEKKIGGGRFREMFGLSTIMSTRMALTVTPEKKYVIEGRGYGHGVGLCQWGSNGLAKSDPKWTYIEILRHYYTDIEIKVLDE